MKPKRPPVILNTNNPERIPYRLYRDRIEGLIYVGVPLAFCLGIATVLFVARLFGS